MGPDPQFINLPHAATVVGRLEYYLAGRTEPVAVEETSILDVLDSLDRLFKPYPHDPPVNEGVRVATIAVEQARTLVEEIVRAGYRGDRLGQCVRNLFECLGLGEEGAEASLQCGERPDSPLRP